MNIDQALIELCRKHELTALSIGTTVHLDKPHFSAFAHNAETEVATVGPTLSKSAEANARLIAAAPALLEALGWLESYLRDTPHHNAPAAANARAAIALAKGEAK